MDISQPRWAAGRPLPTQVQEDRFQGWTKLRQVQDDAVGRRYTKTDVEKCCKDYSEGCEKHYLHRLRKTRATFWHEHGVSLRTIQVWLGHADLSTTQKYLGIQNPKETEHVVAKPMF